MAGGRKSVLITGASTGIGKAGAEHLAESGWMVLAGVRDVADEPAGAHAIQLDVASEESVESAVAEVSRLAGGTLDAVVNNAGIPVTGAIETIRAEDWRAIVDANLTGGFLVTKA